MATFGPLILQIWNTLFPPPALLSPLNASLCRSMPPYVFLCLPIARMTSFVFIFLLIVLFGSYWQYFKDFYKQHVSIMNTIGYVINR